MNSAALNGRRMWDSVSIKWIQYTMFQSTSGTTLVKPYTLCCGVKTSWTFKKNA